MRQRGTEEKSFNTTGFNTLVYGSPARRMYYTGAVTSPCNTNNKDYDPNLTRDMENIIDRAIPFVEVPRRETAASMNLTLKDKLWNSKHKSLKFDDEKPTAVSTYGDEEDSLKFKQTNKKSRQSQAKKSRLNKKTLDTFSASQREGKEESLPSSVPASQRSNRFRKKTIDPSRTTRKSYQRHSLVVPTQTATLMEH